MHVFRDRPRPQLVADGDAAAPLDGGSYDNRVRFEVLGRMRVVDGRDCGGDDAAGLHLGGTRQQVVLAMLLAEPNSIISTDALVDRLWGDSPPSLDVDGTVVLVNTRLLAGQSAAAHAEFAAVLDSIRIDRG